MSEFDKDNNPILYFIEEIQENSWLNEKAFNNMPVADAYERYIKFCQSNGYKPLTKINFSKSIKASIKNIEVKPYKNNGKVDIVFKILEEQPKE